MLDVVIHDAHAVVAPAEVLLADEALHGAVDDFTRRSHAGIAEFQMIDAIPLPLQGLSPIHDSEHLLPDQAFTSR